MRNAGRVNQHSFAQIPRAEIPRSSFNRSSGLKSTMDPGYLYPIFVDEALPGDTINIKPTLFGRVGTMIYPIIDNTYVETFWFAVPLRLLWENFQRFMGERDNPTDSIDYQTPIVVSGTGGFERLSLTDYMGFPPMATAGTVSTMTAFWHRAYNLIWNEWFRDQNLQDSVVKNVGDGPDAIADYTLLRRGKRHDYFSASLPWPQKGDAVLLPLQGSAPVLGDSGQGPVFGQSGNANVAPLSIPVDATAPINVEWDNTHPGGVRHDLIWSNPNLYADLSSITAATINELRTAFQIQRLLEREARGGTRYTELIRSMFGVNSPDQRLQRPKYLGGTSAPLMVNPVPSTVAASRPQGSLAAFGTFVHQSGSIFKSFTEHCVILGLVSFRADLNYQQGVPRMFSRRSKYDFYWPALAHLGEQAVLSKEIYLDGTGDEELGTGDYSVWGYQERWAEYRYKPSVVTAQMRSSHPQSLDSWHLAQDFDERPLLNAEFIVEDPPYDRVIATPSEPAFILDAQFDFVHVRAMPTYSVPGLIDHF